MQIDNNTLSQQKTLNVFLNSFVRDYQLDERLNLDEKLKIKLKEGELEVDFEQKSILGNNSFGKNLKLNQKVITYDQIITLIGNNFTDKKNQKQFQKNIENSQQNITAILEANQNYAINNYIDSEKKLLLGHPFHPYPKCKMGMELKDIKKYSPEFKGELNLVWIEIDPEMIKTNLSITDLREQLSSLVKFDLGNIKDKFYIPMHPWQWDNLQKNKKIDQSKIKGTIQGSHSFNVLSSMRSVFHENSPYILKFSMDIVLTNSVRHLQYEEAVRGKQIETILRGEKICDQYQSFNIQYEPFFFSLVDVEGRPLVESMVQVRENFTAEAELDNHFVLATLCERNPFTNQSKIYGWIKELNLLNKNNERLSQKTWFNAFLENIIKPFIQLACNDGVLLGAHMQNIIIEVKDNIPRSVTYRDCQGTGFSEYGFEKYSSKYPFIGKENGNILNVDEVNKVFGYYLIVNTVFSTISAITKNNADDELYLLNDLKTFLYKLKNELKTISFVDYLLDSEFIYQKGNMRCCLGQLNENTIANPWDIYNKILNPLNQLRKKEDLRFGTLYESKSKSGKKVSFRTLEVTDIDLFHQWHHKDFVAEFWELNQSKEELISYIENIKRSSYQMPLVFEVENEPVGYFEAYWAYDDRIAPYCNPDMYDRGIHLLIGEEKYLRSSIVLESIYHVTKFLLEENEKTQKVWGEPRSDNSKIIRIAEKLPGWEVRYEFDFPHKKSRLLEFDRERFLKEQNEF